MFHRKKTMLYFAAHQDDELLSMGIDICRSLQRGDEVHVILCSDGSRSYVKTLLGNQKPCKKHEGIHCYHLSTEEFVAARDREFRDSCRCLGVPENNIHIPQARAVDGSVGVKFAENLMREYLEKICSDAVICTISPNNGPSQHKDHKAVGNAAGNLLKAGAVRQIRYFIEPYHYAEIAENPRLIPVAPRILTAQKEVANRIRKAICAYSLWAPEQQRYAVGYHSVTTQFDDFLKDLTCRYFDKWDPKRQTRMKSLEEQHRRWLKLRNQKQLYYSIENCSPPELGEMKLVEIAANQLEPYRHFCENHGIAVTEKNLQRLRDGSSFWCLVSPEDVMVSSGWLAWKQELYVSETDFGFSTKASEAGVLYNFNTHPDHRGQGLYGLLLRGIICQSTEPKEFIIYTAPDNNASSRGILKADFRFDGALSAADGSLKRYFQQHGFTKIYRKNRLFGLWVTE